MKKTVIFCGVVCFLAAAVGVAAAQEPADAAGTWDVTVYKQGPKGKADPIATEHQWILEQNGHEITGTVKIGTEEFPIQGKIAGKSIRAEIDQNNGRAVFVTVDGDLIYGSVADTPIECQPGEGDVSIADAGTCELDEPAAVGFARGMRSEE